MKSNCNTILALDFKVNNLIKLWQVLDESILDEQTIGEPIDMLVDFLIEEQL